MIRREPRLAGLEHNAAFRLIRHHRHRVGDLDRYLTWFVPVAFVCAGAGFLFAANIAVEPSLVLLFLSVGIVSALSGHQNYRRGSGAFLGGLRREKSDSIGLSPMLGATEAVVRDLYMSGCRPEEVAAALLGSAVSARAIRNLFLTLAGSTLLSVILLSRPSGVSIGASWVAALNLGVMAGYAGVVIFAPYHSLPVKLGELTSARIGRQAAREPGKAFIVFLKYGLSSAALGIGAFLYAATLWLGAFMSTWDPVKNLPNEPSVPFIGTLAVVGGGLFGLLRGAYVFVHRARFFDLMIEHAELLMNDASVEASDRGSKSK